MEQEQTLCRTAFAHFRTVKSRICGSLLTPHSHANTCQVVGVCPKIWDSKNLVLGVSTLPDTPKNELKIQATHGWYTQLFQFLLLESFESLFCCSLVPFQNVVTTSCLSQISIYIYTYNIYISYIHLTHYIHYIPATSRHPGSPGDQCPHHGGQGQEWSELRLRRAPWLPTEETSQDLGQIGVKSCYSIGNAWWLNYIMFLADFDFVFGALFGIWKSL